MDFDGDGNPDFLESERDNLLKVRPSRIGRTNLLKSVSLPMGGVISLEYDKTRSTYKDPNAKFRLRSAELTGGDPENGATRMMSLFDYEDGGYDRRERTSYGYAKVTTQQIDTENKDAVYRTITQTYGNKSFYSKGLLLSETVTDADGSVLTETINTYDSVSTEGGSAFPALVSVEKKLYTGGESITTTEEFGYDNIGNIISYTSTAGDEVTVSVDYHTDCSNRRSPKSVEVSGGATRQRQTSVNKAGDPVRITMSNDGTPSVFDIEYDKYGNITRLTRPENENGERMYVDLEYDNVLHCLPLKVSDAFGYESSTEYEMRWAVPAKTTDINGNEMRYTYDDFGRPTSITAPYEIDGGDPYTIKFEYDPRNRKARTLHHTAEGDIETETRADALMRPVQVLKTAVAEGRGKGRISSGRMMMDAFGRTVRQYLPAWEGDAPAGYTETVYDALDRQTSVTLPDGAHSAMEYSISEGKLTTKVTDPEGHVSEKTDDARGRTVSTIRHGDGQDIRVDYAYNPLGELLEVTHPNGRKTTYEYDRLGRKTSVDNPDAGRTRFVYDPAGNLIRKITPNLAQIEEGGFIKYLYEYERLAEIQYPQNVTNRVQYTYGEPGASHNGAGRLTLVQDATGGTEYRYGKMGEVVKTIRTILLTSADVRTYVSESEFDSWGRIRKMIYPDGETVSYAYDEAGQLKSVAAQKDTTEWTVIEDMKYDIFGKIAYMKYGNGAETRYTYDPLRQRLQTMTASSEKAGTFLNATYSYDKIDNILGISNTAKPQGDLGGAYSHTYTYDAFSRLISANGTAKDSVTYSLTMEYDVMSNPLKKVQEISGSEVASSHDLTYLYGGEKPNAATQIGEDKYTYDMNGNPTLIENDSTSRQMRWDEENRLTMVNDDGYVSRYTYDHAGVRTVKSHGPLEGVAINGAAQGLDYHDKENYTIYVSPYMTVTADRFTKHYYAGSQRIASKIGGGDFDNVYGVESFHLTAGQKDYADRLVMMESGVQEYYKKSGIPPGPPTNKGQNADPYATDVALPNVPLGDYSVPSGWPTDPKFNAKGDVPGPPAMWQPEEDLSDPPAGYGFTPDSTPELEVFFFHTDHLGSTSYLTDSAGSVCQFVCYTPYGEAFVDEHSTSYENPFKFSGKELDDVTGLYDHGARSRDPKTSLWLGVDPLWEKYPGMSPYNYCAGNPVKMVDPDGKEFVKKKGCSDEDFEMIMENINKLIELGGETGRKLNALKESKTKIYMYKTDSQYGNVFDPNTNELGWCPDQAMVTDNGCILPPIVLLAHELRHAYDKIIEPRNYNNLLINKSKYFQEFDVLDATEDNAIDTEKEVLQLMDLYPAGLNPDRTRNSCYGNNKYYKVNSSTSVSPVIEYQFLNIPNPTEKIKGLKSDPIFIKPVNQRNKRNRIP